MRILGVDPGLRRTGYGIVDITPQSSVKLLEIGTIEPHQNDLFERRVLRIYTGLEKIVAAQEPDVLVLEKLYAHHKHPTTASLLGHVRGVICLLSAQKSISLVEHSVKRIRKSLVGNGNATKEQTRSLIVNLLKIKTEQLSLDASDALALALGHAHMIRMKIL
ncbi:MAG: crossover junction endodeoxyribonuclease RuvC [Candidatus Omnitrophica bacterium]|nr:crossover junction endodeoxyribonuclease RuvC [Candidatus Omnitrophota bacterium]